MRSRLVHDEHDVKQRGFLRWRTLVALADVFRRSGVVLTRENGARRLR